MDKKNYRDEKGQFAQGNRGGPGRPKRHVEVEYLASLLSVCTLAEWEEIVRVAVIAAKNGDHKARDWLTSHVIGQGGPKSVTFTALEEKAQQAQFFGIL